LGLASPSVAKAVTATILATAKRNAFITIPRAVFWEGAILKNNEAKQGNGWGHIRPSPPHS
jgi:hypothetical protein